jgi:hypothetical protein
METYWCGKENSIVDIVNNPAKINQHGKMSFENEPL